MFPRPPRELVLPVSFEKAARELLAFSNADDPSAVAARAVGALAQLVHHMNELVGEIGLVNALVFPALLIAHKGAEMIGLTSAARA